jgi:hypothetical protein
LAFTIHPWDYISGNYRRGTILLGNGASIAIAPTFSYRSLLEHARERGMLAENVSELFRFFETSDFELILRLVWQASNVNKALQVEDGRTYQAYLNVRNCLIEAVRSVHPKYEEVSAYLPNMCLFLREFSVVLSLNYDLLVYWTMTYGLDSHDGHRFKDCFIHGKFDDNWGRFHDYSGRGLTTLVFYPHGSLALCRNALEEESKIHAVQRNLLEAILDEWQSERVVPLFVSEGTMKQKISSIKNSYYLSTIYREVLSARNSTLTLYGWGLGEHDRHLLKRMRGTGIQRVAVSVFHGNNDYCLNAYKAIQEDLGKDVFIDFFDSESSEYGKKSRPKNLFDLQGLGF